MDKGFKHKVIINYCIIFYLLMLYKWFNGMFLYQMQPFFFYNRQDIFTWLFMQTHLHRWLLNNERGCVLMDVLFYSMPVVYFLWYEWKPKSFLIISALMLVVNWCYVQCYTLYPTNSIELHVAWLLFPVAFLTTDKKTFRFLFDGLRYFFLFFFVSAAIWKFVQGGIFNISQMSGVLLFQHKEMLTNSPDFWQSKMILFFINHQRLSFLLYLSATLLELSFAVGFFTKKFDKFLVAAFVIFLLMDYFIMHISYFDVLPFILTLLFSGNEIEKNIDTLTG